MGAEKMGIKVGNPMSKSMTKSTFLRSSLSYAYWEVKHPYFTLEYLSLFHKRKSLMTRSALNTIKKYSYGRQGCFNSNYVKRKLWLRKLDLVMLLDVGLLTSNPIFSAPKSWNWKISVPISKRTSWGFQNSSYFYS